MLVVVVLAAAERRYPGAGSPSVDDTNHLPFRHMPHGQRIVNLPGGEDARDDYRLTKLRDQLLDKVGVNQLRRRRAATSTRHLSDDNN